MENALDRNKMSGNGRRLTPVEAMRLAIAEGGKGWGSVSPNPLVGCVILDRNECLLSSGYHHFYGGPHAEIEALNSVVPSTGSSGGGVAPDRAVLEGATVYVTLEPCAHQGKTGSCAVALSKLPIKKVVYGLIDPYELVAGKGIEIIRAAGIEAVPIGGISHELDADLERLCEHFLWNRREKKPFIALKAATTSDGMMASADGKQKWISNEQSLAEVHRLRAGYDAVLVGKNTFLTDNPSLDVRLPSVDGRAVAMDGQAATDCGATTDVGTATDRGVGPNVRRPNKAIVLDRNAEALGRLPGSNLMKVRPADHIYWVVDNPERHREFALGLGIQLVEGPIEKALDWFFLNGIYSIFVEGGAGVHNHFLEKRLAQRLYLFIASHLNAKSGEGWTSPFSPRAWSGREKMRDIQMRHLGSDMYWTARF